MSEISETPWNGRNVVSTFSGCGGSCLGYRMAGYRVLWANEFIPAAQDTYRLNHLTSTLDTRDIRTVQPNEILEATGLQVGGLDLFDGSPPCASFSTAGKREAGWGKVKAYSDTRQRTDDLFFEYVRLLDGLQPKVFVAENVSGLVKGTAKGYFLEILAALKRCGYRVEARCLDAQWLGVPQMRQRIIFQGVREDLGRAPVWPKPLPYRYSVRDALPWIGSVSCLLPGKEPGMQSADRPCPTVTTGDTGGNGRHQVEALRDIEPETDISRFSTGRLWDETRQGEAHPKRFSLVKPHPDRPCPTVDTGGRGDFSPSGQLSRASLVHPTDKRKFTIAELKRICAFPDDFQLTGSYAQQWERLGRAVPPVMMCKVAEAIREGVLCPQQ